MSESLFKDDVHSLDVEELSDFLESKGIEEADTAELVSKSLHIAFMYFIACHFHAVFICCVCSVCII